MTTKGYKRLLAGASATCFAMGLILLPTAAFAASGGNGNGVANGLDKKTAATTAPTTTTTTIASTPTGTIAPQTTSVTTSPSTLPPQPLTNNEVPGGPGANNQTNNPYASNGVGLPSGNGNGNGNATGKPCAGCVGKADNKNPPGQAPGGSDHNAGYECDRNHGIGRTNPAHTGCTTTTSTTATTIHTGCTTNCGGCTSNCGGCTSNCGGCTSNCGGCTSNCGGCTSNCSDGGTTTTVTTVCVSTSSSPCSTTTTTTCRSKGNGNGSSGTSCVTPPSLASGHGSSTTVAPAKPATAVKASSGGLAFTGADVAGEFLAGGIALAAGAVLLGASRRRRPEMAATTDSDD